MKKIIIVILFLFSLTFTFTVNAEVGYSFTETSKEERSIGFGVKLEHLQGLSTSSLNTRQRPQNINSVTVDANLSAKVINWNIQGKDNEWGLYNASKIAQDYEKHHPDKMVLAATNNWLCWTNDNNKGEVYSPCVAGGQNYRLSGNSNIIANTKDGKIIYKEGLSRADYTEFLQLYLLDNDGKKTTLGLEVTKINMAPEENEIAIIFSNNELSTKTFPGAQIYEMDAEVIKHDFNPSTGYPKERDAYARGKIVGSVDTIDFSSSYGKYYIVSKNATFNDIDKTNKVVLAQHEFLGNLANVEGAVSYFTRIVQNGIAKSSSDKAIHPRTVLAVKEDGSIILSVIDGRQEKDGMTGMDYDEMAHFYKEKYNGYNVFNLDGGGSSNIVVANGDGTFKTINSPSDGHVRGVNNAYLVVVDRVNIDLKQKDIHPNKLELAIESDPSITDVIIKCNGKDYQVSDNTCVIDGLDSLTTSTINVFYKKDGSEFLEGFVYQFDTCGTYPTIKNFEVVDKGLDYVEVLIEFDDPDSTYYYGSIFINDKEFYINSTKERVKLTGLDPAKKYEVKLFFSAVTGSTFPRKEFSSLYEVETLVPDYPIKLEIIGKSEIQIGERLRLEVTTFPVGTSSRYTWTSSNPEIISVSTSGMINGIKEGTSTISIISKEGYVASIDITVKAPEEEKKGCKKASVSNIFALITVVSLLGYLFKKNQ